MLYCFDLVPFLHLSLLSVSLDSCWHIQGNTNFKMQQGPHLKHKHTMGHVGLSRALENPYSLSISSPTISTSSPSSSSQAPPLVSPRFLWSSRRLCHSPFSQTLNTFPPWHWANVAMCLWVSSRELFSEADCENLASSTWHCLFLGIGRSLGPRTADVSLLSCLSFIVESYVLVLFLC